VVDVAERVVRVDPVEPLRRHVEPRPEVSASGFPVRAVLVPFVVSRAISAALVLLAAAAFAHRPLSLQEFAQFDGRWYTHIAEHGYSIPYAHGVQTAWPFFPFLPSLMRVFHHMGVSPQLAGVLLNHVAFLIALSGVYRIATAYGSRRAARLSVWSLALFPTSFVFSMAYAEAIVLAGSVWAFVFVAERRDIVAGALAATVTLARPNGILVAVALVVAVRFAWRRVPFVLGPSVVALGTWLGYVWERTGDPRTVLWAKDAWREISVFTFLSHDGNQLVVLPHLLIGLAAILALAIEWRRTPIAWMVFTALWILPSLVLGMVGMGRYAATTFPPFVAAGRILERFPVVVPVLLFAMAIAAQAAACYWVNWAKDWQVGDPGLA